MTDVMQPSTGPLKQIAMVFDLNKCMGCQSCSVGCKVLWTQEEGEEHEWWMTVNTQPGPYYRKPVVGAGEGVTGTDFTGFVTTDPAGLTYSVTAGTVVSGPVTNGDLVYSGHLAVFPTQAEEVAIDWTLTDQNGRTRVKRITYPAGGSGGVTAASGESMWTGTGWVNI